MKLLKLAIVDLFSFAREKKIVFIIIVLGLITSSFSFIYYFSYKKSIDKTYLESFSEFTWATFEFSHDVDSRDISNLVNILEGVENMPYIPYSMYLLDTNSYNSMDEVVFKSSRKIPAAYERDPMFKYTYPRGVIGIKHSNEIELDFTIIEGRMLTNEDAVRNVALADSDCKLGEKLEFYGQEFEVIGIMQKYLYTAFPLYIIITGDYYLSSNIPCRYINIQFQQVPTKQLIDALCEEAERLDQSVKAYIPKNPPKTTIADQADELIKTLSIIIISLLYIFSLFRYWVKDNIKKYAIYAMCGAGRNVIYLIVLLDTFLLTFINFTIGLILFYAILSGVDLYKITVTPNMLEVLSLFVLLLFLAILGTAPIFHVLRKKDLHTYIQ